MAQFPLGTISVPKLRPAQTYHGLITFQVKQKGKKHWERYSFSFPSLYPTYNFLKDSSLPPSLPLPILDPPTIECGLQEAQKQQRLCFIPPYRVGARHKRTEQFLYQGPTMYQVLSLNRELKLWIKVGFKFLLPALEDSVGLIKLKSHLLLSLTLTSCAAITLALTLHIGVYLDVRTLGIIERFL